MEWKTGLLLVWVVFNAVLWSLGLLPPLPSSKVLYTSLCFSLLIASALIGRFSECRGTPKPTLMGPAISASAHPFHSILFYSKLMDKTASFSSYSKRKREILKYRFPGSPVNTEITFASNANK